ncbi:C-type lectin domain family 12 member A-like isoform X10 [Micropterus salmoides]|uniref:C-type lectin domain family 12 member A-like isoform X10 n=1 Tax=Micropterus salmoides TaxID=27706 RepID=UPI0018EA3F9F|nr:C-type lectin domain family 12 member A-like isoform X10 [Micropterus salmoides]
MLCGLTTVVILSTSQIELNRRTVAMAEEEVSYASVVFKTNKRSPPEGLLPDKKTNSRGRCYQQVACCLGILCVILLLGIIAVCVYKNQNLTSQNTKLSAENQNLTSQNTKLSAENQNLTSQKMKLETKWNELNVSRAQWSIDAYCPKPKNQNRQCKACQDGWLPSQSSCYGINDPDVSGQKTWEEARENCRGKISDLVVIADQTEKTFISNNSWGSSGTKGYWIGLRAEDGKWKWVDGSVLTENSWIQQPATNGQCVISVQTEGWKSVSCGARNRWICKKKALSL